MVKIRLKRTGKRNRPMFRIVVMNVRSKRDGRALDNLGIYDPLWKNYKNTVIAKINFIKYDHWLLQGAQPTNRVKFLVNKLKI